MRIVTLAPVKTMPNLQKRRVAIYARVSSDKALAEDSLDNQVKSYKEQIEATPDWELADAYVDCGVSGTSFVRPEFQRMMVDCRAGKIDMILTKSFSRFARNTIVLLESLRELKELGIEVIFEKDNIKSLEESGELLITLLAAFAQAESQSASENQRWRIKKMFEQGRPNTGRMLGYRLHDGQLVIVPEEVEVVREIFSSYLDGMGTAGIARKLNKLQKFTVNNRPWGHTSIRKVLMNEKYTGKMLLQKTYRRDYMDHIPHDNNGELPMYLVENSHEAIISQWLFDAVQEEIAQRAASIPPKTKAQRHLFTGKIVCGKCGGHYKYKIGNRSTKYARPVWICNTFDMKGKSACGSQQIPETILIAKTAEILGSDDLDTAIPEHLACIRVPEAGRLIYVLKDGSEKEVSWENISRSRSWTPEMREMARQRALARHRKECD